MNLNVCRTAGLIGLTSMALLLAARPTAGGEAKEGNADKEKVELLGKAAPDFEIDLLDGGKLKLSELKDKKIVVLDFWATWCPPCRKALPILIEVTAALKDKDVAFYAVNLREDADKVKKFLEAQKLQCSVAFDKDGAVAKAYGVKGIPQSVIVGKDGTVQAVHVGYAPDLKEKLDKELATLIDGKKLAEAPKTEEKK
jgi:thiol-disulfide isomerase/thioredoxin